MTKDEYGDFVLRYKGCGACFPMYHTLSRFEKMWFTVIQKDITKLEKENAELEYQLTHRNCLDCSNHSSKLRMRTLKLEKENAELKSENQKWKDEWQEQVQKATDEGYARTLQTIQLTKAKEIIREFVEWATWQGSNCPNFKSIQDKAEQFLNSEVEK